MQSPFKFLDAYGKNDLNRFFGREKETAQLYNSVFASNLTLLYGASGTGKTSLINCGLANKFYDTDWLPLFIRRGDNLNLSFNAALTSAAISPPNVPDAEEDPIEDRIRRLYHDHYKPVYLIFDQFEELFILGKKEEQVLFYQTIAGLLSAGLQAKIILIVREEWIAWLNDFEKYVPTLFDNRLRVERMNDLNIARVIAGTATAEGIEIRPPRETILAIIDNLRDKYERVDLTNLQVYLDRLYRKFAEKAAAPESKVVFTPELVQEVGKMENVLSSFLDEQLAEVEAGLGKVGVNNAKGLPLEILFTLVTEDGTKQGMDEQEILRNLSPNRQLTGTQLTYCLNAFKRLRLLRELGDS